MSSDIGDPLGRTARRQEVIRRLADRAGPPAPSEQDLAVRELVDAVRPVVERHAAMAVTVTVQQPDGGVTIQLSHQGGEVQVSVSRHGGAAAMPASSADATATSEAAARIAKLLRDNPHLLDRPLGD